MPSNLPESPGIVLSGEEIMARGLEGVAIGLNKLADEIYDLSQVEVPRGIFGSRHSETLAESGKAPKNDPEYAANPEKLVATVSYGSPEVQYAAAQHEGFAEMHRESGIVEWQVENYSTPGTKKKYLEDPFKARLPALEPVVAEAVRVALI